MRIFEIMTDHVQTVVPSMPAVEAWDLMRTKNIHHLIVKDGATIAGVLSDLDLGGPHGDAIRLGHTVADFMERHFVTLDPDDTVRKAASLMVGRSIGCLPVVFRGHLRGVVTIADLLNLLGRGVDRPAKEQRPVTNHRVPHRRSSPASGRW